MVSKVARILQSCLCFNFTFLNNRCFLNGCQLVAAVTLLPSMLHRLLLCTVVLCNFAVNVEMHNIAAVFVWSG